MVVEITVDTLVLCSERRILTFIFLWISLIEESAAAGGGAGAYSDIGRSLGR
ncbi:MAG TPA: hypothetical protein VI278_12770 [Nitrososphaeraceae archaeon]